MWSWNKELPTIAGAPNATNITCCVGRGAPSNKEQQLQKYYIILSPKQMGRGRKQKPTVERAPCPGRSCHDHIFELASTIERRLRLDCRLEFCPRLSKYSYRRRFSISKKYESIIPRLNADGKIYTPCFILEGDVVVVGVRQVHYR